MRAHQLNAQGVIVNTIMVASLDFMPGLVDASIGGQMGDRVVNGALVPMPPAPRVPQVVSLRQAKRALLQQGKYAAVEAVIDSLPSPQQEEARIDWTSASDVEYDSPMVAFMVQVLPLSESEKDDLFILAATL